MVGLGETRTSSSELSGTSAPRAATSRPSGSTSSRTIAGFRSSATTLPTSSRTCARRARRWASSASRRGPSSAPRTMRAAPSTARRPEDVRGFSPHDSGRAARLCPSRGSRQRRRAEPGGRSDTVPSRPSTPRASRSSTARATSTAGRPHRQQGRVSDLHLGLRRQGLHQTGCGGRPGLAVPPRPARRQAHRSVPERGRPFPDRRREAGQPGSPDPGRRGDLAGRRLRREVRPGGLPHSPGPGPGVARRGPARHPARCRGAHDDRRRSRPFSPKGKTLPVFQNRPSRCRRRHRGSASRSWPGSARTGRRASGCCDSLSTARGWAEASSGWPRTRRSSPS